MPPELIAGRYRVERAAGHGGMGTVWLCHDEVLGRQVAVKQVGVLPGQSVPDLARALREARSSAALHHPHVVSVFDAIEADDHIWLVMEYVPGSTLSELIRREGRLDPTRVAHIGAQVADGLAAAHARGTIHRDVKPANILVTDGDVAKVSDFGIARTEGDEQLTRSGILIGTPQYFSPEIARGADPSPASDVWALGATLFHAVEGVPLVGEQANPIAMLASIADAAPPRPQHAEFLTGPIGRMLDPDPAARWSMADAAHALQRLHDRHRTTTLGWAGTEAADPASTAADPASAAPPPSPELVGGEPADPRTTGTTTPAATGAADRSTRRHRGPWLVAALVLALLVGIGVAVLLGRKEPFTGAADPGSHRSTTGPAGHRTRSPSTPGGSSTGSATTSTAPSPTTATTAPSTTPSTTPTPSTSTTQGTGTGGREQAVVDYYGLLPGDTADAWAMLGPGARRDAGGYSRYQGFWRSIDSVQVGTTSQQGDVVAVELTYNGDDTETRRLEVTRSDGRWVIAEDLGTG